MLELVLGWFSVYDDLDLRCVVFGLQPKEFCCFTLEVVTWNYFTTEDVSLFYIRTGYGQVLGLQRPRLTTFCRYVGTGSIELVGSRAEEYVVTHLHKRRFVKPSVELQVVLGLRRPRPWHFVVMLERITWN